LGRKRVSLADKPRENISKDRINSKHLKRVTISSSNRVIKMAVGITKKEIAEELDVLANSATVMGSPGLAKELFDLRDRIRKDL